MIKEKSLPITVVINVKPPFDISFLTAWIIKQTSLVRRVSCKWLPRWSVKDNEELSVFYLVNYLKSTIILLTYLSYRRTSRKVKIGRKTFEIQQFKWSEPAFRHYFCGWPVRSYLAANMVAKMRGTTWARTKTSEVPTRVRLLVSFLFCARFFSQWIWRNKEKTLGTRLP